MTRLRNYQVRGKYNARTSWRQRKPSMWIPLTRPDTSWFWTNPVHDPANCCVHCSLTRERR